jgi:hypothetical protein
MSENHFKYWAAATVFSLVSLTSLTNKLDDDNNNWESEQRWALSVTVISFAFSTISCFLHMGLGDRFAGSLMELGAVRYSRSLF